ncbi:MAG: Maf family protein [Treponema sp.]|nr:Maf family protein [Treponema sp.]
MEPIILASASPRREEYLKLLGMPFTCMPSSVDESFDRQADHTSVAEELALRKVKSVLAALKNETPPWVCGADTLISLEGEIYGKAPDRESAERMLHSFQGKSHEVISAVALYNGRADTFDCRSVVSTVTFAPLSDGEIRWYLDSGEWQDAAGAYKIQGLASCFVSSIKGSYSSIVGLPLREFYVMLRNNGYPFGG